jgi:drug/metabolite transporter (DMT)-like permease
MDAVSRHPEAGGAGVLVRVARDPLWLIGLVASVMGFGLEATALAVAPVVLVQPLIVAELPLALPLAALVVGRRLGRHEWSGIAMVTAGLVAVEVVIRPTNNPILGSAPTWAVLFLSTAAFALALILTGRRLGVVGRTTALAAAAGATFGLLSVVTKATTHQFGSHGLATLLRWEPWALAAVGLIGMTLAQNAYRSGPLAVSLPLLDLGEPICGSVIAIAAFHERLGGFGVTSAAVFSVGVLIIMSGVLVLDRSALVRCEEEMEEARPVDAAR